MHFLRPENAPIKNKNQIFALAFCGHIFIFAHFWTKMYNKCALIVNPKPPKNVRKISSEKITEIIAEIDEKARFIPAEMDEKVKDLESIKCNKFVRRFRKTQRPVRI